MEQNQPTGVNGRARWAGVVHGRKTRAGTVSDGDGCTGTVRDEIGRAGAVVDRERGSMGRVQVGACCRGDVGTHVAYTDDVRFQKVSRAIS